MPKIIKINMCAECPFVDTQGAIEMRCLRAPSEKYGTVIEDIFEIPDWCPLQDDDRQELLAAMEETKIDVKLLRELLWLNHGHSGQYGDDGEMQCGECLREYGFYDWKRTSVKEIHERIYTAIAKHKAGKEG